MSFKLFVVAACLALAQGALVKRDAPAAASPLEELQKHAEEFQKTFSEQLSKLSNSENTQQVNKALKEGSETIMQQITAFGTALQTAVKDTNGKAAEALEKTKNDLQRTAEELRKAHPEVEQEANKLKEKLDTAVTSTVEHAKLLAKEFSQNVQETNEKLAPKLKEAFDEFVKQTKVVQEKLASEAAKH